VAWMAGEMLGMRSLAAEVREARSGAGINPNSESTKVRIAAMAKNGGRVIEAGVCAQSTGVKNGAAFCHPKSMCVSDLRICRTSGCRQLLYQAVPKSVGQTVAGSFCRKRFLICRTSGCR
jgi:hypothetical protein